MALAGLTAAATLAACSSSGGGSSSKSSGGGGGGTASGSPLKITLVPPSSGALAGFGADALKGW